MSCILCKKEDHNVFHCNSIRAQTVDDAINHWVSNRLVHLYETEEYLHSIDWISQQSRFTRLTRGDLLYLIRNCIHQYVVPDQSKDACIDIFLSKKTKILWTTSPPP